MSEATGIIKRFSHNPGKMPGIQVQLEDGTLEWFNATLATQAYMKGMANALGRIVTMTHEAGKVSFIHEPVPPSALPSKDYLTELERNAMIIRQTCIKVVAEIVKVDTELQDEEAFIKRCQRLEDYVVKGN